RRVPQGHRSPAQGGLPERARPGRRVARLPGLAGQLRAGGVRGGLLRGCRPGPVVRAAPSQDGADPTVPPSSWPPGQRPGPRRPVAASEEDGQGGVTAAVTLLTVPAPALSRPAPACRPPWIAIVGRIGTLRATAPASPAPRGVSSMAEQRTFNP